MNIIKKTLYTHLIEAKYSRIYWGMQRRDIITKYFHVIAWQQHVDVFTVTVLHKMQHN